MSKYQFITVWRFDAPLEKVWESISHPESWHLWWRGVVNAIELEKGNEQGVGSQWRFTWRGIIPYRLLFDIRTTRIEHSCLIEGEAFGDLEGTGTWFFSFTAGQTVVRYEWRVRTTKKWMNILKPFAWPFFIWNHDKLMERGRIGLAGYLRVREY